MPIYDVHLIELVRVKVAAVEADSPEQALALARCVDMHDVLNNESPSLRRSALRGQPQAMVESVSYWEAPTNSAMVEVSGSHGEQGEHHFDQFEFDEQGAVRAHKGGLLDEDGQVSLQSPERSRG